ALAHPDGTVDQLAKRAVVHIIESLEVQAALSGPVRAQPCQHRLVPAGELADQVDDQVLAARREARQRRVALVPGAVPVVVRAEADDAGSPHGRWLTGDLLHHGAQPVRLLPAPLVWHPGQKLRDRSLARAHRRILPGRHTDMVTHSPGWADRGRESR